jgi:hypothetical protein
MYFVNEGGILNLTTILLLQLKALISFAFNKIGLTIK